jgi:hypothetical protein
MPQHLCRFGALFLALSALSPALKAQPVQLVDVRQTGWYDSNATRLPVLLGTTSALQVTMFSKWGQTGIRYATPQNWSRFHGFVIRVKNLETTPVNIGMQWDANATGTVSAGANLDLMPLEDTVFYVDFTNINYAAQGMRSPMSMLQGYYKHRFPWGSTDLSSVHRWHVYLRDRDYARVQITSLQGLERSQLHPLNGMVDEFGQYIYKSWNGRVKSAEQIVAQKDDEDADLASVGQIAELLGSTALPHGGLPTGAWRVRAAKDQNYFISPEGRRFWSVGACHVVSRMDTVVQGREHMFAQLPSQSGPHGQFYGATTQNGQQLRTYGHYSANLFEKFGETWRQNAATNAMRRLRSWGINTVGSGSDITFVNAQPMPFTFTLTTRDFPVRLSGASFDSRSIPDPFAADFESWSRTRFGADLGFWANHAMLLGCYVDGETPWGLRDSSLQNQYWIPLTVLRSAESQPAKSGLVDRLTAKYLTIGALNTVWGTSYSSWAALRANTTPLTGDQVLRSRPDLSAFLITYVETYARKVRGALKGVKNELLYLGGREAFFSSPTEAFRGMEQHADVVSVTFFDDSDYIPWDFLNTLARPVLITEFSFTSQEGNSFPQTIYPRIDSATQADRAASARKFLDRALSQRNVIGAHWFNYIDQPVTGRAGSIENMAFGLVDVTDKPYPEMIEMFRSFSRTMYRARGE